MEFQLAAQALQVDTVFWGLWAHSSASAAAWIGLLGVVSWFRKHKFRNDDAKSNWIAQIINAAGQTCLLLGILLAG